MATGTGLGGLLPVAMVIVGLVTMLRSRARRRAGASSVDEAFERRQAEAAEMERRMASYLAGRDAGRE
jgi:cytochrome c-type biogenesis protein CcmH/NrfF